VARDDKPPLTQLLARAAQGERGALDEVFSSLYPELHRIAHARLHAHGDPGLGTTTLVHETFLRLVDASQLALADRKHFYAYAAKAMRHIIIDFAREHLAERRGGGAAPLTLDTALAERIGSSDDGGATLVRINDALLALEALDAELARVVEMRYFAGYAEAEIASLLGTSERTVRRQWDKARAFLLAALRE
jgi:RNA polymerase sigma factor (TIGR02999 family)